MADDLGDVFSAFGSSPAAPPPPVAPVAQQPTGPDDLSDLHAAFGKGAAASPPGPGAKAIIKDVAKQAGASLVEGPIMATIGAPGDIADASRSGGTFDKAYLALEHKLQDMTGWGPQSGTPERAKFDSDYLGTTKALDILPKTPTTQQILGSAGVHLPEPQTDAGRYTRMTGDFATGAALNGGAGALAAGVEGGAPAVAKAAAIAGAKELPVGAAVQGGVDFANATGNEDLAPIAQFVVPGGYHKTVDGIGRVGAAAARKVASSPTFAQAVSKVAPSAGNAMFERQAGQQIASAANDPAALRQSLADAATATPDVTGFAPTAFQQTGDLGIGQLERMDSRNAHPEAYMQRAAEQKAAQAAAIGQMTPIGDISTVPAMVGAHMDATHAAADAFLDQKRSEAQAAATAAGIDPAAVPEAIGTEMQGHLDAANQQAKAAEGALHRAVDPDGTLVAPTADLKSQVGVTYADLAPADAMNLHPQEQGYAGIVNGMGDVASYRDLFSLKSNLATAMRQERIANGQSPALRRMSQMMSAVQDTMHGALGRQVAAEGAEVAAGAREPADTTNQRLRDLFGVDHVNDGTADAEGLSRTGTSDAADVPAAPTPAGAAGGGGGDAAPRGSGSAAGGAGVAPTDYRDTAPRVGTPADTIKNRPESAISRLQRAGGVRDAGGDMKAAGLNRYPGLITRNGIPLDRAREILAEEGYLGHDTDRAVSDTTVADLLDKLTSHPTYSIHDEGRIAQRDAREQERRYQQEFAVTRRTLEGELSAMGIGTSQMSDRLLNRATYHMMEDGHDAYDAYGLALTHDLHDNADLRAVMPDSIKAHFDDANASLGERVGSAGSGDRRAESGDADQRPGEAGAASRGGAQSAGDGERRSAPRLEPDEDASGRLRAANAATAERHKTFGEGAVGEVLKPGKRAGEFKISASAVPDKIFRNGPAGADAVRGYLKASGGGDAAKAPAEAVDALKRAAILKLREKALSSRDGTIGQAGLDAWKKQHNHALRAIEDAAPGFLSGFDTAAKAGDALVDAVKIENAHRKSEASSAIGKLVGVTDESEVVKHIGAMVRAKDGPAQLRDLMARAKGNEAAQEGIRSAVAQSMADSFLDVFKDVADGKQEVKPRQFLKMARSYEPALREAFTPQQMDALRKIAETYDIQQRSITGNKLAGGSDTQQNKGAATIAAKYLGERNADKKGGHHGGLLSVVGLGAYAGYEHGGVYGALAAPALAALGHVGKALRDGGMDNVRGMMSKALLNPEYMKQLLDKVPEAGSRADKAAAGALRRSFIASAGDPNRRGEPARSVERIEPTMDRAPPHPADPDRTVDGRWNVGNKAASAEAPDVLAKPLDTPASVARTTRQASADVLAMVKAYHGTPHEFDRFDIGKIGTGEGNQAYGHGLYFAENKGIAEGYQKVLSLPTLKVGNDRIIPSTQAEKQAYHRLISAGNFEEALRDAQDDMGLVALKDRPTQQAIINKLQDWHHSGARIANDGGNLYHVAIDREPEHFLDWDKPLSEQSAHVKAALSKLGIDADKRDGYRVAPSDSGKTFRVMHPGNWEVASFRSRERAVAEADSRNADYFQNELTGQAAYRRVGSQRESSDRLSSVGVAGIRYLDAGSRTAGGNGTRNYVVFHHDDVKITHRNGVEVSPSEKADLLAQRSPDALPRLGQGGDIGTNPSLTLRNTKTGEAVAATSRTTLADALARHGAGSNRAVDPVLRASSMAVGKRLSDIVGNTPVYTVTNDAMKKLLAGRVSLGEGASAAGLYDVKTGSIYLNEAVLRHPEHAASVVLHEGLHAALHSVIEASPAFRDMVDHLRLEAAAQHIERGGKAEDHYGLTNAHEFVSESMSTPEFQRFLASIPASRQFVEAYGLGGAAGAKPTIWSAFTSGVRQILGFKPQQQSLLDAAMKVGGHLLDTAEVQRRVPAGGSVVAPQRAPPATATTHRAGSLMPKIRSKVSELVGSAAPPEAKDFARRAMSDASLAPDLMSVALAPRLNGVDSTYQSAFKALDAKGMFSTAEKRLMDSNAPAMRRNAARGFPGQDVEAMNGAELRAAAFAHFANGRTEEGTQGEHLHIGIRRAFERVYGLFSGLQSAGNRMGLYRPNDVYRMSDEGTVVGLAPQAYGEANRAQVRG